VLAAVVIGIVVVTGVFVYALVKRGHRIGVPAPTSPESAAPEAAHLPAPPVGEDIYVPSQLYMSHGRDDFEGGLCRVAQVKGDLDGEYQSSGRAWIEVEERPGHWFNWDVLGPEQDKLRRQYGSQRGHPDPDDRWEFNRW
jgi:hypothetical protein